MIDAISIALSGLTAQKQKLGATANNIANISTTGTLPAADAASTVYRPLQVTFLSLSIEGEGAGVAAEVTERTDGWSAVYDPSSPHAGENGLIVAPNVNLEAEALSMIMTKTAYKANVATLKTADEMTKSLLDTLA